MSKFNQKEGLYAIYKPKGPSSNKVVMQLKKITGIKKVGHAGTLDPLAEGVLVVGIGREYTRKMSGLVKKDKEYVAKIFLGAESATDDEEGDKKFNKVNNPPTEIEIKGVLKRFEGLIEQVPPKYSAIKIKGKEAYKRVRKGEVFDMPKRKALIKEVVFLGYQWPILELKFTTGSGVYIRSLARDIGNVLGVGGYLADLKRTRVGDFKLKNAIRLDFN